MVDVDVSINHYSTHMVRDVADGERGDADLCMSTLEGIKIWDKMVSEEEREPEGSGMPDGVGSLPE